MGRKRFEHGREGSVLPPLCTSGTIHPENTHGCFRGYKCFLCSQAFCLGRAVTKTVQAAAGEKGEENMLILDQKELHLFASCAFASQRGHGQELMFAIHTVLSGKAGPRETTGPSYAPSWQIILETDVLP